ncbi:MAG TPA: phosphoribosyltransferase family protein [Gemmatimonadales bacterium]|nr:phosphoribosyltransferase family protein [Gemmatimonadales bacterium]
MCVEWPAAFQSARSAVWLEGGAQHAVHALKYAALPRIAEDLALAMAPLRPRTDEAAALIPIPLAPKRLRTRGYNQSEVLARALARKWRIPVIPGLLVRTRETPTQTALTPLTRLANVAGAFDVRRAECGAGNLHRNAIRPAPRVQYVLVDDVFTTGATLAEAARALEQAGATTIHAVTFARAAIPDFS